MHPATDDPRGAATFGPARFDIKALTLGNDELASVEI
jgi:hypothetical protein